MDIKSMQDINAKFSESRGWFYHKASNTDDMISKLGYNAVAISGEVGEFANLVKKVLRNKERLNDEMLAHMKEKVADVFIYTLIVSQLLNMDLESEFLKKQGKNEGRFEKKN
ncbi:MAG: MazG nucleotide pyrophosphohydrolase domain-containing protein [Candidatus Nanoarchaeia archaeon]|nr:MazG nucleotide pyrophosphohydrolase domain-containing protein [Candidatus Nanoarchaeia archaeon]MDD5239588.1 MazG nucleotide pyrophosphohydrolase domain-containing protein [Candidatus Nanoarchaeia archaeon]